MWGHQSSKLMDHRHDAIAAYGRWPDLSINDAVVLMTNAISASVRSKWKRKKGFSEDKIKWLDGHNESKLGTYLCRDDPDNVWRICSFQWQWWAGGTVRHIQWPENAVNGHLGCYPGCFRDCYKDAWMLFCEEICCQHGRSPSVHASVIHLFAFR